MRMPEYRADIRRILVGNVLENNIRCIAAVINANKTEKYERMTASHPRPPRPPSRPP
jgi:hypothetical protein